MNIDPFKHYIRHIEAGKKEKSYAWQTAIGLQDVDGLQPSRYLLETAMKNIDGEISIEIAEERISRYYEENRQSVDENRTEEADKVSVRIARLLSEPAFSFNANQYLAIHKYLFSDIYPHAGQLRRYNMTKKEWILDGDTVLYGSASELQATLEYDLAQEKAFSYKNLPTNEIIEHLAVFIARLWQIHVFEEGNTRTSAVFFIQYLKTLGFNANNDIFAEHAWYFRNALVRANYTNLTKGVHNTTEYLVRFMRNLLLNENNRLSNRQLHINSENPNKKQDINPQKQDIEHLIPTKTGLSSKTRRHIGKLHQMLDTAVFSRIDVINILNISPSAASELLRKMCQYGIILPVSGLGKGKYRFTQIGKI